MGSRRRLKQVLRGVQRELLNEQDLCCVVADDLVNVLDAVVVADAGGGCDGGVGGGCSRC